MNTIKHIRHAVDMGKNLVACIIVDEHYDHACANIPGQILDELYGPEPGTMCLLLGIENPIAREKGVLTALAAYAGLQFLRVDEGQTLRVI